MTLLHSRTEDAARRAYVGVTRATLTEAQDKPQMQELTVRGRYGERITNVEHWHPYGLSYVPLPPEKDKEAEVLLAYLGGSPDHPIALGVADRRHRPRDLKPGDLAHHDHRGSLTLYSKDGITKSSPLTITHQIKDKDGTVQSSVVQKPNGDVTITNAKGATLEIKGASIVQKPGPGGKLMLG